MTLGAHPLRILVVDDEPAILRFLRPALTAQDYVVVEAESGQPAIDVAQRDGADLIVLDLGLPDIDGLEVIRRVRAAGLAVPIVVLSSRDDEQAKVAALDLGANDFVAKPFGIDELLARIRTALRRRQCNLQPLTGHFPQQIKERHEVALAGAIRPDQYVQFAKRELFQPANRSVAFDCQLFESI